MAIKLKRPAPPKCACGCGQSTQRGSNGQWNKFLIGHNARNQSASNNGGFRQGNKHGKGRPKGSKNKVTIAAENVFVAESGAIARKATEMALEGNPAMIRLVLERIVPIKKSTPVKLDGIPIVNNASDVHLLTSFLLEAMATGKISPIDGEAFSRVVEKHINALRVNDLEIQLKEIEKHKANEA